MDLYDFSTLDVASKPSFKVVLWPCPVGINHDSLIAENTKDTFARCILHFKHNFDDWNTALRNSHTGTGFGLSDQIRQFVLGFRHRVSDASRIAIKMASSTFAQQSY